MLPSVEQADTMIVEEESSTYGEIQPRDAQKEALADVKLRLFDTNPNSEERHAIKPVVPDSCTVDLDLQVINMLEEMARKRQPRKEKLYDDYFSLKQKLGRRPTYVELHLMGRSQSIAYRQEFDSYIGFLYWADELTELEKKVFKRYEDWFIKVEKTNMSKSYKMVVLKVMLDRGVDDWYQPITPEQAASEFHQYLTEKEYRKRIDLSDKTGKSIWTYNEKR